jgi:hypothetical protein
MVEANEDVGDDEAALGEVKACVRERDRGLELRGVVVRDVADHRLARRFRLVEVDDPRADADERVTAEASVLDRLEQERRVTGPAQAEVRPERGEEVGCDDGLHDHGYEKRPSRGGWKRDRKVASASLAQAPAPLGAPCPPALRGRSHCSQGRDRPRIRQG